MTLVEGAALLREWLGLLEQIDRVSLLLSCDLEQDEVAKRVGERQQAIDGIQQLDAQLKNLALLRKNDWAKRRDPEMDEINNTIEQGRAILSRISRRDAELINIANEKRQNLLVSLRVSSLSKGYRPSQQSPKIRPPVIVDGRA